MKGDMQMNFANTDTITINLLKNAVESEGCRLAEVDFENLVIKVDGADEVVGACARAVAEVLD
jgi:phage tail tube protein FII